MEIAYRGLSVARAKCPSATALATVSSSSRTSMTREPSNGIPLSWKATWPRPPTPTTCRSMPPAAAIFRS